MRFSRGVVWALVGAAVLLPGCGGGGGGGGPETVVAGFVYDSAKGDDPVEGATVVLGGVTTTTTRIGEASAEHPVGSFTLRGVATGATTAQVTAPGLAMQTIAFYPAVTTGTNASLALYLNIGQVRGRVLLPDGTPARDAFVYLAAGAPTDAAQTGADGTFLIEAVPAGPVEVTALAGTASVVKQLSVDKGVTEAGDLKLVDDPNPNPPAPPRTVFGKITLLPTNEAGSGTQVVLFRGGIQYETTVADAAGNYWFYVAAGDYTVRAIRAAFVDTEKAIRVVSTREPVQADLAMPSR